MSGSGLTGVRVNNKNYLYFNQYSNYPSSMLYKMGELIVFLRENNLFAQLGEQITKLKIVKGLNHCSEKEFEKYHQYSTVTTGENTFYTYLLRKLRGAEWIKQTALGNLDIYINDNYLLSNPNCQWTYIINLDTNNLEIYRNGKHKIEEVDLNSVDTASIESLITELEK